MAALIFRQWSAVTVVQGDVVLFRDTPRVGKPSKLTPELIDRICADIESGVFPHVAAQANGISIATHREWINRGTRVGTGQQSRHASRTYSEEFAEYARRVEISIGIARARQEKYVFIENPEFWLQKGPGKSTPDSPGWTEEKINHVNITAAQYTIELEEGKSPMDYLRAIAELTEWEEGTSGSTTPTDE